MQVLIPCYTESLQIVKNTVLAAADAMLPDKCKRTVYLLDDGKDADKAAWVAEQGREDIVYRSGRVRQPNETNGKACNLNNTLKWLYPADKCVADEEVSHHMGNCPYAGWRFGSQAKAEPKSRSRQLTCLLPAMPGAPRTAYKQPFAMLAQSQICQQDVIGAFSMHVFSHHTSKLPVHSLCQCALAQLLVIFDADMVCSNEFFVKILAELYDPQVALVLTPQAFHNYDPSCDIFNHSNLIYWQISLPGVDGWDNVSCTGTNFVVRARAAQEVGEHCSCQ